MYKLLFDENKNPRTYLQIVAAIMLMLFGTIVFSILIAEVFVLAFGIKTTEELSNVAFISPLVTIISYILVCRLLVTMFTRANRTNVKAMGIYFDKNSRKKIFLGSFLSIICIGAYFSICSAFCDIEISKGNSDLTLILLIIGELVTIMGEELLFRGYIQRLLMTRYPSEYAIFLSLAIIAIYTFTFSWGGIIPAISLLLEALIYSLLLYKSGSLLMPFSFHVTFNLLNRYVLGIEEPNNSLLRTSINGPSIFADFRTSVVMIVIYVLLAIIIIYKYKKVDNEAQEFKNIQNTYLLKNKRK